jgi:hypothetical protein
MKAFYKIGILLSAGICLANVTTLKAQTANTGNKLPSEQPIQTPVKKAAALKTTAVAAKEIAKSKPLPSESNATPETAVVDTKKIVIQAPPTQSAEKKAN